MKQRESPANHPVAQTRPLAKRPRDSLPWRSLEQQVVRMQKQIMHASERGDKQAVYTLQQRLMESEAARLLAVRRVTEENQGKHTAGIDGVKSLGPRERLAMASTIHPNHWSQQPVLPVRRVWVPKPGSTERRPLAILPMIDRCKQALVKLALEPEWEPHFEAHSYGFRPGRGVHDAITAILVAIEGHSAFVFNADIEAAFDHVNQIVVLDKLQTFAALRRTISAWLTAGVIDGDTYLPSETGIAQGGVLSPLLMNVALHGLEAVAAGGSFGEAREQPLLVRYADNFVMAHQDLNVLQQAVKRVKRWLATRGLQLHAEKTHLTHTLTPYQGRVGFEFLGFSIRQEWGEASPMERRKEQHSPRVSVMAPTLRWDQTEQEPRVKTIITPGLEARERHLAALEHKLRQLQTAPQAQVMKELNPLIASWAAYYNGIVEASIMSHYDDLLEQRLLHWASLRHPGKTREWLLARYWHPAGKRRQVFATADGVQLRAYRQASVLKGEGKEP